MLRINSVFILRKSVNYRLNLFSKRNMNSTTVPHMMIPVQLAEINFVSLQVLGHGLVDYPDEDSDDDDNDDNADETTSGPAAKKPRVTSSSSSSSTTS